MDRIEHCANFLTARAKGDVPTGARFIREYVTKHPLYKKDSKLTPCLSRLLTLQVIKLNSDVHIESCCSEKDTEADSDETKKEDPCMQEVMNKIKESVDDTSETEGDHEEQKQSQEQSQENGLSQIVESFKSAIISDSMPLEE